VATEAHSALVVAVAVCREHPGGHGAVNVGWGCGGGGGGGGVVLLVYNILTRPGTIRAAGGAKGMAPGGAPATDGSAGKVVYLAMS
jgi:hypothetical protein